MIRVKRRGLRTALSFGAAAAVLYFGTTGPEGGRPASTAVLVLAAVAGTLVWFLTKPGTDKPVS